MGSEQRGAPTLARLVVSIDDDPPRIVASGELDLTAAPLVRAALEELRAAGHRRAVVDFARVSFVDLAGLRAFASAAEKGYDLEVRNPSPWVRRILQLTALDTVLRCEAAEA